MIGQLKFTKWIAISVALFQILPTRANPPDELELFFRPEENGVELTPQSIEYDLTDPYRLIFGPLELDAFQTGVQLSRETVEVSELVFGEIQKKKSKSYVMSFKWPQQFINQGRIEIINDQSKVLWRSQLDAKMIENWQQVLSSEASTKKSLELKKEAEVVLLDGQPEDASGVGPIRLELRPEQKSSPHRESSFGLIGKASLEIPIWKIKEPFRLCVIDQQQEARLAACSPRVRFQKVRGIYEVTSVTAEVRPRVLVNGKEVTSKGSAVFLDHQSRLQFVALLANGSYYEVISKPKKIDIVDLYLEASSGKVKVMGFGHKPTGEIKLIDRSQTSFWRFLDLMPTIGDFREFWQAEFPVQEPYLYFVGDGEAPFRQTFYFESLPRLEDRVRLPVNTIRSTYSRRPRVKGKVEATRSVSSNQESAAKVNETEFNWSFAADKKGEANRALIKVGKGQPQWQASHEIYRGMSREFNLRSTALVSNELELIFVGELATQIWFEDLFGWQNSTFSRQRWGVAAKHWQSVAATGGNSEGTSLVKLQNSTADLKYRLTPGVWGRDPTVGLMASAQSVTIERFSAQMWGAGGFWARSMPKVFDRFISWIPGFDYPKWVDVEFIYYPFSLDPSVGLGLNTAVNFHGKIQWSKYVYGEAGFGLRTFDFSDLRERKKIGLGLGFVTLGVGVNF